MKGKRKRKKKERKKNEALFNPAPRNALEICCSRIFHQIRIFNPFGIFPTLAFKFQYFKLYFNSYLNYFNISSMI